MGILKAPNRSQRPSTLRSSGDGVRESTLAPPPNVSLPRLATRAQESSQLLGTAPVCSKDTMFLTARRCRLTIAPED